MLVGRLIMLKAVIEFRWFWVPGVQQPDGWARSERSRRPRAEFTMEIEVRERLRDESF